MSEIYADMKSLAQDNPTADPLVLAAKLVSGKHPEYFIPIIAEEIAHRQRVYHRTTESAAFATGSGFRKSLAAATSAATSPTNAINSTNPNIAAFRKLFDTPFALGNGTSVTWKKATMEEHQKRVAMLTKLRGGLDKTIAHHQEAIRILKTTGAKCLEDVAKAS